MTEHSLRLVAIGLGQAGGNLAAEFHHRGYPGLAFNTARTDLSSLGASRLALPEDQRIYIGLEGHDGAGGDVAYGRECIREHADRIRSAVDRHAADADVVILAGGLGGGTGSCLAELAATLSDLSLPLVAMTPLPHQHESGIVKVNALYGIHDLVDTSLQGWILADNAQLARGHQDTSIDEYFETINREIVDPLDVFNRLNERDSVRAIRALDGEDLRTLLLSGGILNYNTRVLEELSAASVIDCVRESLGESPIMPGGFELGSVAYLGLVIEASEKTLRANPFSLYEEVAQELKRETGGAAVYVGLYERTDDDAPSSLRLLCSSQALPTSISERLSEAEREAGTIQQKVQQNVPALDLSGLEKLRLVRLPRSRSVRAERTPPAAEDTKVQSGTPAREPGPSGLDELRGLAVGKQRRLQGSWPPPPAAAASPAPAPERPSASSEAPSPAASEDRPEEPSVEPSGAVAAPAAISSDPLRVRYRRLEDAYRASKRGKRVYIARELVAALRSEESLERFYAVLAMARLGDEFFREALTEAATDSDSHVADLAKRALAGKAVPSS